MNARRRIGDWVIIGEFYRSERVVVLKVVHNDSPGKVVALKLCLDTDAKVIAAFKHEIENARRQPLPGKMPVMLDHGVDESGCPYFVMPKSRDVTKMRKSEKLAVAVTRFLVACAIELRELGLMHRDLKPDNVGSEVDENGKEHFVLRDWATMRSMVVQSDVRFWRCCRAGAIFSTGRCWSCPSCRFATFASESSRNWTI